MRLDAGGGKLGVSVALAFWVSGFLAWVIKGEEERGGECLETKTSE